MWLEFFVKMNFQKPLVHFKLKYWIFSGFKACTSESIKKKFLKKINNDNNDGNDRGEETKQKKKEDQATSVIHKQTIKGRKLMGKSLILYSYAFSFP